MEMLIKRFKKHQRMRSIDVLQKGSKKNTPLLSFSHFITVKTTTCVSLQRQPAGGSCGQPPSRTPISNVLHSLSTRRPPVTQSLMVVSLCLVASGQGVHVGVVDERPGAISPRESLVPDAHMIVWDELWPGLSVVSLVAQVGVHHAQGDRGNSHEPRQLLPQFVAAAWKEQDQIRVALHNFLLTSSFRKTRISRGTRSPHTYCVRQRTGHVQSCG